jgi:uncharacterized protein (TIGR00730 family)
MHIQQTKQQESIKKNLTVFCSSKQNLDPSYYSLTYQFIKSLNPQKFNIVYGGGSSGLMGTVRSAWLESYGTIISSNITKFVEPEFPDDYVFDNIIDRQKKLIDLADGYLVLPGGYGTHYETLEAITKNDIGDISKPVFILNINGFFDHMIQQIDWLVKEGFVTRSLSKLNVFVEYDLDLLRERINSFLN